MIKTQDLCGALVLISTNIVDFEIKFVHEISVRNQIYSQNSSTFSHSILLILRSCLPLHFLIPFLSVRQLSRLNRQ